MDISTAIQSRFKTEWTTPSHRLRPLHLVMKRALATADKVEDKQAELIKMGTFSDKGRLEAIRKFIRTEALVTLAQDRAQLDGAIVATAGKRKALLPPKPDPEDQIAAGIRSEMRSIMRMLNKSDLSRMLLRDPDDMAIQAVFEVPPFLSGVDKEMRTQVELAHVKAMRPKELRAVEEQETAISLVETAFTHVLRIISNAAGFAGNKAAFDDFMAEASGETQ